jgi:hypothetical protein
MNRCAKLIRVLLPGLVLWSGALRAEGHYPDAAHPWAAAEYVNFFFGHYNGNQALPHLREAGPKAVFEHLVDWGNVDRLVAADVSAPEKLRQLGLIISVLGEARGAYNTAVIVGEPLAEELTRIQLFTLHAISAARVVSRHAPEWPEPVDAWKTSLLGVAQSLGEVRVYSAFQRQSLAAGLASAIPALGSLLTPQDALDLADRIYALNRDEGDSAVRRTNNLLLHEILIFAR